MSGQLLRRLVVASRPVSWVNTAYPFAVAWLLGGGALDGAGLVYFVVGTVYFLVPYNLAMYGINDVYDYESDRNNPRKGGAEGALLPPETHAAVLWAVAATNLPFLVYLFAAGNGWSAAMLALSVFALLAYSVPGLRFKERPFLDSLTSAAHFFSPALVGLAAAGAGWSLTAVAAIVAFALWGMASHAFGAVQDILADRAGGIGSIATVLGATATVRLALGLWAGAGLIMLVAGWPAALAGLLVLPYLLNAWPYRGLADEQAERSNRAWRRFLWLNYLAGFLLTMLLIVTAGLAAGAAQVAAEVAAGVGAGCAAPVGAEVGAEVAVHGAVVDRAVMPS